ncbi:MULTISPECIES: ABC transporter permease [unclassified Chelatococcus]|jgi:peptide/nickel transport system permease protein|uniref:ABC transporter permease n=1 Tax=unclassified Chelatococcus TaxID=2638111 RepID=UPI001BD191AF|nr:MULTISPECIES: ABC transporter permease [unclassified Chelatococcus]CAH1672176.1 Peptide/nickel transport system permease protein [Hyphomicrobiales bacterium]MBS7738982.1 ABC transporter permease [Chelatococcus sp. HY11]MBX3543415.1 ABC transporter permease [Chelatococcus sp.]MCO5076488.1 ABC transporter permease [Chelatococcus sp.]CAH1675603.1 Peptide/nickel transport system permease protein [Hyphomicrobiales bacterium]
MVVAESADQIVKRRRFPRLNLPLLTGGVLFAVIILLLLGLPIVVPLDPEALDYAMILTGPSAAHWLGTDALGRDLLARIVFGGHNSLAIGALVMLVTAVVGTVIGLIAGTIRRLDGLLMRSMDVLMAFPALLLALAILAAFGNTALNVVLALSLVYIPRTARIVRGEALVLRKQTYVEAAEAIGVSRPRVLLVHILPGILPALMVQETFLFAYAILGEAGLSFVGLGLQPPEPSWGNILGEARSSFQHASWLIFYPGLALGLTVLSLNLLGDGLGQAIDPKRRQR